MYTLNNLSSIELQPIVRKKQSNEWNSHLRRGRVPQAGTKLEE